MRPVAEANQKTAAQIEARNIASWKSSLAVGAGTGRTLDATTGLALGASVRSALLVDPDKWKLMFLQPFKTVEIAKTGHSDRRMLFAELTLECLEERGNGVVADLT